MTTIFHSPIGLYPFQATMVGYCVLRPSNLVAADTGLGKLVRDSEPILTPTGWRKAVDIEVGDLITGVDGRAYPVLGVYPQGPSQIVRMTFSDGSWADTSWDHIWTVQDLRNDRAKRHPGVQHAGLPPGRWREMTVRELLDAGLKYKNGGRKWKIPTVAPIEFAPVNPLPIDPYLLGIYLAEGSGGGTLSLNIEDAPAICGRIGVEWQSVPGKPGAAVAHVRGMRPALRQLGLIGRRSWEKFIPEEYLFASIADRTALLQGLMDGDGDSSTSHHNEFSSTSPDLIDGVTHLVQSLGGVVRSGKPRITKYAHNGEMREGRESYRLGVKLPLGIIPFSAPRKLATFTAPEKYLPARIIESVEEIDIDTARCFYVDSPSHLYVMSQFVVTHNTVIALAAAGLMFEDQMIDKVLCLVERNKIDEWRDDFAYFTPSLKVLRYRGARQTRMNKLRKGHDADVILVTHETAREDLVEKVGKESMPGPLVHALRGKRVLVIMDEMTVYGGHKSALHRNLSTALNEIDAVRRIGLTGTPLTSSPFSYWALGRILCPERMQDEQTFYSDHVTHFNQFGQPRRFMNLGLLQQRMDPVLLRKRKTDDDVRAQFPTTVEKFVINDLDPEHLDEYERLTDLAEELGIQGSAANSTLRNFANHPGSILESESKLAEEYLARYGGEAVSKLSGVKSGAVLSDIRSMMAGGDQVLVFCDSTKVIRSFSADLAKAKIEHGVYSGDQGDEERERVKAAFKAGEYPVLLLSKAGERGMNLPEAGCVINYDIPPLFSSYIQRLNRGSRIGSNAGGELIVKSYIAGGTVEEGTTRAWNQRNAWSDTLVDHDVEADDEVFLTAEDRAALLRAARERQKE